MSKQILSGSFLLLLNTSFNLAGETLVETKEDALNIIKKSNINYLYLPN